MTTKIKGRWDAAEEARLKQVHAEENRYDPRLNMSMAQAQRTPKPGIYLSAPGKPMFPVPELIWHDKFPDMRWLEDYKEGGFVVIVTSVGVLDIARLPSGAGEARLADDFWFLQHGAPTFGAAELKYAMLQDELNRMMLKALIGFYAGAAGVSFAPGATSGESLLLGGAPLLGQGYQVYETWKDLYAEWVERTEADKAASQATLTLPVLIDERAGSGATTSATPKPNVSRSQVQRAAPGTTTTRSAPIRERTDGFVRDLASICRDSIVEVRTSAGRAG